MLPRLSDVSQLRPLLPVRPSVWLPAGGSHVVWDPTDPTSSHLASWSPGDNLTTPPSPASSPGGSSQAAKQQPASPSSCQPGVLWLPVQMEVEPGQLLVAEVVHNTIGWVGGWAGAIKQRSYCTSPPLVQAVIGHCLHGQLHSYTCEQGIMLSSQTIM
jgi:hypothetical protein